MDAKAAIIQLLDEAPEDVKTIVAAVLKIETNYIHMTLPRGVNDDIQALIERVIK